MEPPLREVHGQLHPTKVASITLEVLQLAFDALKENHKGHRAGCCQLGQVTASTASTVVAASITVLNTRA